MCCGSISISDKLVSRMRKDKFTKPLASALISLVGEVCIPVWSWNPQYLSRSETVGIARKIPLVVEISEILGSSVSSRSAVRQLLLFTSTMTFDEASRWSKWCCESECSVGARSKFLTAVLETCLNDRFIYSINGEFSLFANGLKAILDNQSSPCQSSYNLPWPSNTEDFVRSVAKLLNKSKPGSVAHSLENLIVSSEDDDQLVMSNMKTNFEEPKDERSSAAVVDSRTAFGDFNVDLSSEMGLEVLSLALWDKHPAARDLRPEVLEFQLACILEGRRIHLQRAGNSVSRNCVLGYLYGLDKTTDPVWFCRFWLMILRVAWWTTRTALREEVSVKKEVSVKRHKRIKSQCLKFIPVDENDYPDSWPHPDDHERLIIQKQEFLVQLGLWGVISVLVQGLFEDVSSSNG